MPQMFSTTLNKNEVYLFEKEKHAYRQQRGIMSNCKLALMYLISTS